MRQTFSDNSPSCFRGVVLLIDLPDPFREIRVAFRKFGS